MTRAIASSLIAACLVPLPAVADEGTDFIAKLTGRWSGAGTIRTSANDAPGATRCSLNASGSGAAVVISGSCDGAGRGANLSVSLKWVAATRQFTGTFSGAAESGRPAFMAGCPDPLWRFRSPRRAADAPACPCLCPVLRRGSPCRARMGRASRCSSCRWR
jgi:hypothetical protein